MLLLDWTDEDLMRVLSKLKTQDDYHNYHQPTMVDFSRDVSDDGWKAAMEKRAMWNQIRMNPTDLAGLSSATLTYLVNGVMPVNNWTGLFTPGETVRLHLINGSGNAFYGVHIPGLKLKVVQVDGQNVELVTVDELRLGPGEIYDVLVAPKDDTYTIFSQSMGHTDCARGTLAVCRGLRAAVPALNKMEQLSTVDMMGDMGGMGGMSHGGMSGMDHGAMSGMNHSGMPDVDHGDTQMMDDTGMTMMNSDSIQMMDYNQYAEPGGAANDLRVPSKTARHIRMEYGPNTDMHVDMAHTSLDDPGVDLRNNGCRVLVLTDMHIIGGPMDKRDSEREVELHLTGDMERYTWLFDGVESGKLTLVHFRYGERLRVILHNNTMMMHPIHLHSMQNGLEAPDGTLLARRHTIFVQPTQRTSFLVTAGALGRWAWHCHLMLHVNAGMFREVVVVWCPAFTAD